MQKRRPADVIGVVGDEWQSLLCCSLSTGSTSHVLMDLEESMLARCDPTRAVFFCTHHPGL